MAAEESKAERLDRELIELLNEIRVLLPGVQVLFAFLLTAPFATGFEKVTEFQRDLYAGCLLTALAATACLVAPTTYHRVQWRQHDKDKLLRVANGLILAGSALLVGDYLFDRTAAILATLASAVLFLGLWYALPLWRRADERG
jgi:hypothetical protein